MQQMKQTDKCEKGHKYSKEMNQKHPRRCVICGKKEKQPNNILCFRCLEWNKSEETCNLRIKNINECCEIHNNRESHAQIISLSGNSIVRASGEDKAVNAEMQVADVSKTVPSENKSSSLLFLTSEEIHNKIEYLMAWENCQVEDLEQEWISKEDHEKEIQRLRIVFNKNLSHVMNVRNDEKHMRLLIIEMQEELSEK